MKASLWAIFVRIAMHFYLTASYVAENGLPLDAVSSKLLNLCIVLMLMWTKDTNSLDSGF